MENAKLTDATNDKWKTEPGLSFEQANRVEDCQDGKDAGGYSPNS